MIVLHIMSASVEKIFDFEHTDIAEKLYNDILGAFGKQSFLLHFGIEIKYYRMDDKHKAKIDDIIEKYTDYNISLRQIGSAFKQIKSNSYFCFIKPNKLPTFVHATLKERFALMDYGIDNKEIEKYLNYRKDIIKNQTSSLFSNYEIKHVNPERKTYYGENDKTKRVCRYCGKSSKEGAIFKSIGHTIPESLGNKTIISNEECDECNSYFANGIEEDIFDFVKLHRVLRGSKGKKGIPKLRFKNGIVISNKNGKVSFEDEHGNPISPITEKKIYLEFDRSINFVNVYRTLVKAVIGVIDQSKLSKLKTTIQWLRNPDNLKIDNKLPNVAIALMSKYFNQPVLNVYLRKNRDRQIPYLFADMTIACYQFVFIIPYVDVDEVDFSVQENYDIFWRSNPQYDGFKNWKFLSWNNDEKEHYDLTLNFNYMR